MNYIKANFHTHSVYCDGKSSLEENVQKAVERGIEILGFSGHSVYPFAYDCSMDLTEFDSYCNEIRRLKDTYRDKIDIRLGFEADYIPGITVPSFKNYDRFKPDFLIGSVHYIWKKDGLFAIDESPETLMKAVSKYYDGDARKFICEYFSAEKEMLSAGDFTILGHCDLIRKFNEKHNYFDEDAGWYKKELEKLAEKIAEAGVIAEINTGGITRGWISKAYPSDYMLKCLKELNVPVLFSSDSHNAGDIDGAFDVALAAAKKAGYTEIKIPGSGFCKI